MNASTTSAAVADTRADYEIARARKFADLKACFENEFGKDRIAKLWAALGDDWDIDMRVLDGKPTGASIDWRPGFFCSHGEFESSDPASLEDQLADELRNFARVLTDTADRIQNGKPWTLADRPGWVDPDWMA